MCFPTIPARFIARDQTVRDTRKPALFESEETLQGTTYTFINRAYPVLNEQGDVTAIIGMETDITDLHNAERRSKENETRFRAIFESAAIGIALFSLKGRVITCNPTYADILGYPTAELVGLSFVNFTH